MKILATKMFISAAVLASLTACGQVLNSVGNSNNEGAEADDEPQLISIDAGVTESDTALALNGFALAAASKFSINVEGCASGYTSAANETKAVLNVYRFDRGCVAKLTALEYGGISYAPSDGVAFTTWQVGDSAIFTDGGSNQIRVNVTAQLSNPVGTNDAVAYSFSEVAAGTNQVFTKSVVGAPKSMAVGGQAAPAFIVKSLSYNGITNTGAGEFGFDLECASVVSGSGLDTLCADLKLNQLRYVLVKDDYEGSLTAEEAAALFAPGSAVALADVRAAGSSGMANGGFSSAGLVGPDQMHLNPNMLLVLEGAGTSYLYFNVDVSTISQDDTL